MGVRLPLPWRRLVVGRLVACPSGAGRYAAPLGTKLAHLDDARFRSSSRKPKSLAQTVPRKEVIQAHLPVHLPCYDFVPVTSPTFDGSLLTVRIPASGVTSSHDVTGGVYKARERIHRTIADARLLATPASCRRVAACNLN
jgi:hypothetical protein